MKPSTLGPTFLALGAVACPTVQPSPKPCTATSGNITVSSFQLYPENADFDTKRCLAYFSVLYNSTVTVWNPQTNKIEKSIAVPGLSGDSLFHLSGVKVDPLDRLSMIVNAGTAFDTAGANITGSNFLVKYDLATDEVLWRADLAAVTKGAYGGYQDVAHDAKGTSFAVGTFPSSLIRVTADGEAAAWYLKEPADHTVKGFSGLVPSPDGKSLLVTDSSDGQLYRFDMAAEKGVPEAVPIAGAGTKLTTMLDGVSIPSRWGGKVVLVTDNNAGTHVLYSADASWKTAELRGTVPNGLLDTGASATATVQVGGSVYGLFEYFIDDKVPGTLAGNRTQWPLIDITDDIEKILRA